MAVDRGIMTLTAISMAIGTAACTPAVSSVATPMPSTTATVLRAVDGDTIDVLDDARGRLRIRILNLDAPELHKPGWSVGCFAAEAAQFADLTLTHQRVAIIADPTQDARDRYGRTLAYVQLGNGRNFSIEAVAAGMAHAYTYGGRPGKFSPEISAAEAEAKKNNRGLWGPPCHGNTVSQRL